MPDETRNELDDEGKKIYKITLTASKKLDWEVCKTKPRLLRVCPISPFNIVA